MALEPPAITLPCPPPLAPAAPSQCSPEMTCPLAPLRTSVPVAAHLRKWGTVCQDRPGHSALGKGLPGSSGGWWVRHGPSPARLPNACLVESPCFSCCSEWGHFPDCCNISVPPGQMSALPIHSHHSYKPQGSVDSLSIASVVPGPPLAFCLPDASSWE